MTSFVYFSIVCPKYADTPSMAYKESTYKEFFWPGLKVLADLRNPRAENFSAKEFPLRKSKEEGTLPCKYLTILKFLLLICLYFLLN